MKKSDAKFEGVEEMSELLKEAMNLHEQFTQVIEKITQSHVKLDYDNKTWRINWTLEDFK